MKFLANFLLSLFQEPDSERPAADPVFGNDDLWDGPNDEYDWEARGENDLGLGEFNHQTGRFDDAFDPGGIYLDRVGGYDEDSSD